MSSPSDLGNGILEQPWLKPAGGLCIRVHPWFPNELFRPTGNALPPPDRWDWVPADHPAHFVIIKVLQLAEQVKLAKFGQVTGSIDGTKSVSEVVRHRLGAGRKMAFAE